MARDWCITVAFDAASGTMEIFDAISFAALDALEANPITLGPVGSYSLDPPILQATVSVIADDEVTAVALAIDAITQAYREAGAELGAIRRVDLMRQEIVHEELDLPDPDAEEGSWPNPGTRARNGQGPLAGKSAGTPEDPDE